jgi:outer membrane protein insertion porin family
MTANRLRVLRTVVVVLVALSGFAHAKEIAPKKAGIEVDGLGWLGDRDQRLSLERLLGDERREALDANAIEDAALLLLSSLEEQGYLKAVLETEIHRVNGDVERFTFDLGMTNALPRPTNAEKVIFRVRKGVRYVVSAVSIEGLSALPEETARSYFRPDNALFAGAARAYTPGRLRRQADELQEELRQRGYAEAKVRAEPASIDDKSGEVGLTVRVIEGARWWVDKLSFEGADKVDVSLADVGRFVGQNWSTLWQQNVREAIRQAFYARGYPDVSVRVVAQPGEASSSQKPVAVVAQIVPGQQVRIGEVRFEGAEHTRRGVLQRRVSVAPGDPLNPLLLERSRYRLSRLGVFTNVDLRYEPADGEVRDPVFSVREGRRWDASTLVGYGSYEQFRAGIELRQLNLFGYAHQSRLELVQSMKSSRGEYTYTVPELFGESLDGTAKLFGLQRQERAFLRQEFGVNLSVKRPIGWLHGEGRVGYTFQFLRNQENELSSRLVDNRDVRVGSLDFALTSDRRDSPLRPQKGYRWFVEVEAAARALGGESHYQRTEIGGSYHTGWGRGRWFHVGLTHGVVTTWRAPDDRLLPVNKRFFPGGDSSIRGYPFGTASPRGPDGRYIGAKSYLLGNFEIEQALTKSLSVVAFTDALGMTARMAHYPFDEKLFSVGLGVRYQTLIGPVRLEYGRNLNPRLGDPHGTLHFSVGFPF